MSESFNSLRLYQKEWIIAMGEMEIARDELASGRSRLTKMSDQANSHVDSLYKEALKEFQNIEGKLEGASHRARQGLTHVSALITELINIVQM